MFFRTSGSKGKNFLQRRVLKAGEGGGIPNGTGAAPVEVYDEQNNKWSYVDQSHIFENNFGAVEIEGRAYFVTNNFPVDSGIRIPPEEVYSVPLDEYPVPLDEWENLRKINNIAVLCYLLVKNECLKAE